MFVLVGTEADGQTTRLDFAVVRVVRDRCRIYLRARYMHNVINRRTWQIKPGILMMAYFRSVLASVIGSDRVLSCLTFRGSLSIVHQSTFSSIDLLAQAPLSQILNACLLAPRPHQITRFPKFVPSFPWITVLREQAMTTLLLFDDTQQRNTNTQSQLGICMLAIRVSL